MAVTMDADEEKAKSYLEQHGFIVSRFSKVETRAGQTPDFRVSRDGHFAFFCEVKSSPADRWLDAMIENVSPGEIVGGGRKDPIFNRMTADIHKAVKQFDAVNENREYPNVLFLINHDKQAGFLDLLAVLTGNFYAESGTVHPIYRQFSHGRIKSDKGRIDLFIWLDDKNPDRVLFSQTNARHHAALCAAFGTDPSDIQQIEQ